MDITDDMIVTFDAAYMVCAETHVGGDGDTSERCCIATGIERVAPLIAAQALRSGEFEYAAKVTFRDGTTLIDTARTTSLPMAHHRAATIRVEFPPRGEPDPEDVAAVEVLRRTIGQWEPLP